MSDQFAHLRANLDQFRAVTRHETRPAWCRSCEMHRCDDSGLCPLCRPD